MLYQILCGSYNTLPDSVSNHLLTLLLKRGEKETRTISSVMAETMKLIANSSYGYHIMDRSRHTTTKYATKEKMNKLNNESKFESLSVLSSNIFEVEPIKPVVDYKEPIIVSSSFSMSN